MPKKLVLLCHLRNAGQAVETQIMGCRALLSFCRGRFWTIFDVGQKKRGRTASFFVDWGRHTGIRREKTGLRTGISAILAQTFFFKISMIEKTEKMFFLKDKYNLSKTTHSYSDDYIVFL